MDRWALFLSLLLSPAGCLAAPASEVVDAEVMDGPVEPGGIEAIVWKGCATVAAHGGCELGEDPLVVWIPQAAEGWRWSLDGAPLVPSSEPVLDGARVTLEVPRIADGEERALALRDAEGVTQWGLTLVPGGLDPLRFAFGAELVESLASKDMALRRRLAERLLEEAPPSPSIEGLARIRAARQLSHDASDVAASALVVDALLDRSVEAATQLGRWSEPCEAAAIGLFIATNTWNPQRIAHWERWVEPCRSRAPEWDVGLSYYLGVARLRQGRYSDAEDELAHARDGAARLGLPHELLARKREVELMLRTGRWTRARRELEALEHEPLEECAKASLDADIGFYRLLARERGDVDLGDPRIALHRALASHTEGACAGLGLRNYDQIKLGLAAASEGDAVGIARSLDAVDPATLSGKLPTQYQELRVLDALERRAPSDAHQALDAMEQSLSEALEPAARWRMAMLRAAVAQLEDDREGAISAHHEAEGVLDEIRGGVTSDAVRDRWLTGYRRSATGLVERLIDAGRIEEAACAARSARSRALAMHDLVALGREGGRHPDDPCRRPWGRTPDELVLLIFPRQGEGWWVFEIRADEVRGVRALRALPDADSSVDGTGWWDRWSSSLEASAQVRVLPSAEAYAVAFHRLGWRGVALQVERPVVYGLDLGVVARAHELETTALVVFADVDPLRSLERYAPQVAEVDAILTADGWETEWIENDDVLLVPASLREELSSVTLFHYYGHGDRSGLEPSAEPLEIDDMGTTALVLAAGARLEVEDVLDLSRAPRWAVLLGCQLGQADLHGWSGGLSFAHAFLLAGTEEVMASTRALDASAAATLGERLYTHDSRDEFELGEALHDAWAAHHADSSEDPPWRDLRVWSR